METIFFYEPFYTRESFARNYNMVVTESFLKCAGTQLRHDFERRTGIKINKNISTTKPESLEALQFDTLSCSFNYKIYVNHNWNPVQIKWTSKSGRVYGISDEDIDSEDIIFWFEGLDPLLYHQQLYPKEELPFKLKKLNFEVEIKRLAIDLSFELYFKNSSEKDRALIVADMGKLINDWNFQTEKEDAEREKKGEVWYDSRGVIHNFQVAANEPDHLVFDLDVGSADVLVLKKMIQMLDKKHGDVVKKIVVG